MKQSRYHGQFGIEFSKIHEDRELAYVVPLEYRIIVVIVGLKYAGKTVVTDHLVEDLGFRLYSLSRFVREEVDRLALPQTDRAILKEHGDRLRRRYGCDYLAKRVVQSIRRDIIERLEPVTHISVDGIKNTGEIEFLKRLPRIVTIGVAADGEERRQRAESDGEFHGSIDGFVGAVDGPDCNSKDGYGQQVDLCLTAVEHTLWNNSTKRALRQQTDALLRKEGGLPREYSI
jgi:hypothetical protein